MHGLRYKFSFDTELVASAYASVVTLNYESIGKCPGLWEKTHKRSDYCFTFDYTSHLLVSVSYA